MAELSKAVFLSYASQDAEAARRICEALRAAGIEVWFDQNELRGGDAWDQQIRRQIRDCALFIPVISSNTQARLEGYFRREWKLAVGRTHDMADEKPFLVPVVIDETADQGASVPEIFHAVQWTRLPSGETPPAFAERISCLCSSTLPAGASGLLAPFIPASPPGKALPDKPSIAVLPFRDMTAGTAGDYFCDGVADEITTALSRFSSLFVIANSSTLAYRGEARNLRLIARELGVRYLLEGDVRQAGEQVRISVKLTDAVDNLPFWNQRFDGIKEDAFALQEKVASMIAAQIEPNIEAAELRRISANPALHPGPYELYLRALHAFRRFGEASNAEALGLLEQALRLDPTFGPALELASQTHTFRCLNGWTDDVEATRKLGQEFSRRALQHGPSDPRVLIAAAMAAVFLSNDLEMAAIMVERALVINPYSSTHLMLRGWIKLMRGEAALALEEMEAALRLNPQLSFGAFALLTLGFCHLALRRFDEAIKLLREAAHRRQESELLQLGIAVTLAQLGQIAEAKRAYRELKPRLVPYFLELFRGPAEQEILRTGLALIEAG
jgi:TolB-like protein